MLIEILSPAYHFQIDGHSVCCFSRDVLVTIMTRIQAGLSGVRIPAGARDFLAATHPATYSHVPGFYPRVQCGANVDFATRLHQLLRLETGGAIPVLPQHHYCADRGNLFSVCFPPPPSSIGTKMSFDACAEKVLLNFWDV